MMAGKGDFYILFTAIASHKVVSALALSSRFLKEGAHTTQVRAMQVWLHDFAPVVLHM